jgi:hypothetical protein
MMDKLYVAASHFFPLTAPADKFVVWTGTTWELDEIRWGNYCRELANAGVNFMRWLGWNHWFDWYDKTYAHNLTPWLQQPNGLYDLTQVNEAYWKIAERMIEIANYPAQKPGRKAPGITLQLDLAYEYMNDKDDQQKSPWRNNVQGIVTLYAPAAWPYFEKYMLRWLALGKKHKIVFGMGNEMGSESLDFCRLMLRVMDRERVWPFSWGICAEIPSNGGNDVFKALPDIIFKEGLYLWHPLRTMIDPATGQLFNRWDCSVFRPVHACGEKRGGVDVFDKAFEYFAFHPIRWKASDDGCMGETGKPGAAWWYSTVNTLCTERGGQALTIPWDGIEHPLIMVEHLPDDELYDIGREKHLQIFAEIARAYREAFGPLENEGQWPDVWAKPPVIIEPPDDPYVPPPVKPHTGENWAGWWRNQIGWIKNRKWWIVGLVALVILFIALKGC